MLLRRLNKTALFCLWLLAGGDLAAKEFNLGEIHPQLTFTLPEDVGMTKGRNSVIQYLFRPDHLPGKGFIMATVFPAVTYTYPETDYATVVPVPTTGNSPSMKMGRRQQSWSFSKVKSAQEIRYMYETSIPFADLKIRVPSGESLFLYLSVSSGNPAEAEKLWQLCAGLRLPGTF